MQVLLHKGPINMLTGKGWMVFAGWKPLAAYIDGNAETFCKNKVEIIIDFDVEPEMRVHVDYSYKGLTSGWVPSEQVKNQLRSIVKRGALAQTMLRVIDLA